MIAKANDGLETERRTTALGSARRSDQGDGGSTRGILLNNPVLAGLLFRRQGRAVVIIGEGHPLHERDCTTKHTAHFFSYGYLVPLSIYGDEFFQNITPQKRRRMRTRVRQR